MNNAHGRFSVSTEGNIIHTRLVGSFNLNGATTYCQAVKKAVIELAGRPFAVLVDDLELEGGTPEAYQELDRHNQWMNEQAMVAKAFLIDNAAKKAIILQNSPAIRVQNVAFFTCRKKAREWLEQQIIQEDNTPT